MAFGMYRPKLTIKCYNTFIAKIVVIMIGLVVMAFLQAKIQFKYSFILMYFEINPWKLISWSWVILGYIVRNYWMETYQLQKTTLYEHTGTGLLHATKHWKIIKIALVHKVDQISHLDFGCSLGPWHTTLVNIVKYNK